MVHAFDYQPRALEESGYVFTAVMDFLKQHLGEDQDASLVGRTPWLTFSNAYMLISSFRNQLIGASKSGLGVFSI
jgi:hypothetical protein